MDERELAHLTVKEAYIERNREGYDIIVARLGLEPHGDEPPLGMDAVVCLPVQYYVPAGDGSPLPGLLGDGYSILPTNLSELPKWREAVLEDARWHRERENGEAGAV